MADKDKLPPLPEPAAWHEGGDGDDHFPWALVLLPLLALGLAAVVVLILFWWNG
jgi:hypothetical protein